MDWSYTVVLGLLVLAAVGGYLVGFAIALRYTYRLTHKVGRGHMTLGQAIAWVEEERRLQGFE